MRFKFADATSRCQGHLLTKTSCVFAIDRRSQSFDKAWLRIADGLLYKVGTLGLSVDKDVIAARFGRPSKCLHQVLANRAYGRSSFSFMRARASFSDEE